MKAKRCPHCGADLPPSHDAFCVSCNGSLDATAAGPAASERGTDDRSMGWPGKLGAIGVVVGLVNGVNGLIKRGGEDPFYAMGYLFGYALIFGLLGLMFGFLIRVFSGARH